MIETRITTHDGCVLMLSNLKFGDQIRVKMYKVRLGPSSLLPAEVPIVKSRLQRTNHAEFELNRSNGALLRYVDDFVVKRDNHQIIASIACGIVVIDSIKIETGIFFD